MMRNKTVKSILSVKKGLDVLFLFKDCSSLGIREMAERLEIPASTTYRFARTLETEGVLEQDPTTKKFSLGARIFGLAAAAIHRLDVRTLSLPHMQILASASKETVQLMLLRGSTTVCIEIIESPEGLRVSPPPGRVLPLHAGAFAKVIAAFLPQSDIDRYLHAQPLESFTHETITDPDRLTAEFARIREHGYAVSHQEVYAGAAGVAAPIFDNKGVVASIGIGAPLIRLTHQKVQLYAQDVVRHAAEISAVLGYHRDNDNGRAA